MSDTLDPKKQKLHDKILELQAKFTPESTPYAVLEDVIESIDGKKVDEPYIPEFKDNHERLNYVSTQFLPDSPHSLIVRDAQDLLAGKKIRRRLDPTLARGSELDKIEEDMSPAAKRERIRTLNPAVARAMTGGGVPITNQRGFIQGAD
jgi:hypothetical protein